MTREEKIEALKERGFIIEDKGDYVKFIDTLDSTSLMVAPEDVEKTLDALLEETFKQD